MHGPALPIPILVGLHLFEAGVFASGFIYFPLILHFTNRPIRPLGPTAQTEPPACAKALNPPSSNWRHVFPLSVEISEPEVPVASQALVFAIQITAERNPFGPAPTGPV